MAIWKQLRTQCLRAPHASSNLERVPALYAFLSSFNTTQDGSGSHIYTSRQTRSLATRPASRPKAHTGTPAARKPRAKAAAATPAKKPAKKPAAKAKKPKAAKKPKKVKKSKKAVAKKPRRKVLTPKQKEAKAVEDKKRKIKELKKTALEPPSPGATTAWLVLSTERNKGKNTLVSVDQGTKAAAADYKNLTPERREVCPPFTFSPLNPNI